MSTNVSYQVITSLGPVKFDLTAQEAIVEIKQKAHDNAMWVYINGTPVSAESLTLEDITRAEEIMLTSKIVGG
jgi:hypothetical protein